jgi:hypothetical protein
MEQNITEIELNGMKYVRKDSVSINVFAPSVDEMDFVMIRSYASGVHFGYLKNEIDLLSGKEVELINSRRVHSWQGAASLSQLSVEGTKLPANCKIAMIVPSIRITQVIEIIKITETAKQNLEGVAIWKI